LLFLYPDRSRDALMQAKFQWQGYTSDVINCFGGSRDKRALRHLNPRLGTKPGWFFPIRTKRGRVAHSPARARAAKHLSEWPSISGPLLKSAPNRNRLLCNLIPKRTTTTMSVCLETNPVAVAVAAAAVQSWMMAPFELLASLFRVPVVAAPPAVDQSNHDPKPSGQPRSLRHRFRPPT